MTFQLLFGSLSKHYTRVVILELYSILILRTSVRIGQNAKSRAIDCVLYPYDSGGYGRRELEFVSAVQIVATMKDEAKARETARLRDNLSTLLDVCKYLKT